jgi:D-amino-acid dehydrogenase
VYDLKTGKTVYLNAGDPTDRYFTNSLARAEPWAGLRPATPGNVPLIGRSARPGLWLNTGHGTLGWTLACGSAAALAELMSGRRPAVAFPFLAAD